MESVFVIVVTYNASIWVNKCFTSLKNSIYPVKTIVIDNGSKDDTTTLIQSQFPEVELINANENLGFGKANNLGIKKALDAGADYIFLLNHDAWINPDTIGTLVTVQKENQTYGVVSPIHMNGEGTMMDHRFYSYITEDTGRKMYSDIVLKTKETIFEFPFVNAAAWLVSKTCFEKVGGFDPLFPHYGEDVNFINRVRYHEIKVGVVPSVIAFHDRESRVLNSKRKSVDRSVIDLISLCGNLSESLEKQVDQQKKTLNKKRIKALVSGKLEAYRFYSSVLNNFLKKVPEIRASNINNRTEGMKYLDEQIDS